jgi:hypothetical protein
MTDEQVSAGWYPDPAGEPDRLRYWNGTVWTEYYQRASTFVNQSSQTSPYGSQPYANQPYANQSQIPPAPTTPPASSPYAAQGYIPPMQVTPTYIVPPAPQTTGREGFAVASLVLSLLSVFTCCCLAINFLFASITALVMGVLALIFGIIGTKSARKGVAVAGIVLGSILIVIALLFVFIGLLSSSGNHPTNTIYDYVAHR